jgi:hypothetical protein
VSVPAGTLPTYVIASTALELTSPGTFVVATNSGAVTATLPVRSQSLASTGYPRVGPEVNVYQIIVLSTAKPVTIQRNAVGADTFHYAGVTTATSIVVMPGETVTIIDDGGYWLPIFGQTSPPRYRRFSITGAATATLDRSASAWVGTATSGTPVWTLPAVADNAGMELVLKNRGTVSITVQRAGSDNIYDTGIVVSVTLAAGASMQLLCDGTYWLTT